MHMGHDDSWPSSSSLLLQLDPSLPCGAVRLRLPDHQTARSGLRDRGVVVRRSGARSRMSGEEADGSKPQGGVHYGTFQGPPSYPPPRPPPQGFPQPVPPPGLSGSAHHRGGYQAVPGNTAAIPFLEYYSNSVSRRTILKESAGSSLGFVRSKKQKGF